MFCYKTIALLPYMRVGEVPSRIHWLITVTYDLDLAEEGHDKTSFNKYNYSDPVSVSLFLTMLYNRTSMARTPLGP